MLIFDFALIGSNLYFIRKKMGMTQAEVAENAGISDRTYADIERGTVNMRVETLLRICKVLNVTPNEILSTDTEASTKDITEMLNNISDNQRKTALKILQAFLENT